MPLSRQALPHYKRPRKIIFDKVPRNATGKIEKPKLRLKYGGNVMGVLGLTRVSISLLEPQSDYPG